MLPNPVKGEVSVACSRGVFTLCYSWPSQKAVGKRFGMRFRDLLAKLDTLDDDQLSYLWWAGFQHHHPTMDEQESDGIISELGMIQALVLMAESVAAAFDIGKDVLDQAIREATAETAEDPPPAATRSTRKRASATGSN